MTILLKFLQTTLSLAYSATTTSRLRSGSTEKRVSLNLFAGSVINVTKAKSIVCYVFLRYFANSVLIVPADLTEPIDIYSEWIDAADAAQRDEQVIHPTASSSRRVAAPASVGSDDE